ncbi:MAG: MinD/ParA family protein [Spirochaetes bacterium]|nr:MinD/ParA family protein [Spirochaetota bacterium]
MIYKATTTNGVQKDQAERLRLIMKNRNETDRAGKSHPRILTISSGKGGVGKTNIAINLGIAFAEEGKRVVVMDADLGLANVNVILGIIPKFNLYHVIRKQKRIRDIIVDTQYGIQIIAGASGFSQLANLQDEDRANFVDELKSLAYADIIIIDTGAGVSQNVLSFLRAADEAIIVTTPEPTAITDAYGIIKSISSEVMGPNIKLVVNRVNSMMEGKKVAERVINIAGQFLNIKVDNLGFIFEDSVVPRAVIKQDPFIKSAPKSKASESIRHLKSRLLDIRYTEEGGLGRFLKNLFGSKG